MFNRQSIARVLPFAAYMGFIALADLLGRFGWDANSLRWLYAVKIAVVICLLIRLQPYPELANWRLPLPVLGASVLAGVLVWLLWINLDAPWMVIGSSTGFDPRTDGQIDWLLVAIRLMGAAVVVPLMEELFWRSFLLRWIESVDFLSVDPRQVKWLSCVASIGLFGIEHNLWFAGVVAGAVYSGLYIYSRNLWSAIVAHAVTNGVLGVWIIMTSQWTYW